MPAVLDEFARRVNQAGGELYVVGGWVRDLLMGTEPGEFDLATNLSPDEIRRALEGLGAIHDIGEKFGTLVLSGDEGELEITTFRSDEYRPGSRHPQVSPVSTIEEDLARRDFTVNAVALSLAPERGCLVDPFGGLEDVRRKVIRTPGRPEVRMAEDPLRMMRAVRFSAQLGFGIEPGLLEVLRRDAERLDEISWERRKAELELILVSPRPDVGVRTLVDAGLMDHVAPEVSAMEGVEQPPAYHRADVLEHTLLTMTYLPAEPLLRRAALFHDLGKPPTKVTVPKTMFPEHDKISETLTRRAMRRLRYGRRDVDTTAFLVRRHMRPIRYEPDFSDAAVRRLVRDCTMTRSGRVVVPVSEVLELARADVKAGSLDTVEPFLTFIDDLERRINALEAASEVAKARSPLDGRELMRLFDRGPGPWLKEVKSHLADLVLEGTLAPEDKEEAARRAREFLERSEGFSR